MIAAVIEFSRYWFALLFGAAVAVSLAGMARTRKNYLAVGCFTVVLFIMQIASLLLWGPYVPVKI